MAEGAKKTIISPPKRFQIPADLRSLGGPATPIINQMRAAYHWRMREGCEQIGSGRKHVSKRNKPNKRNKG